MRVRSEVVLAILSAAMPEIFAADVSNTTAHALVHDSLGQPVLSSSGECWHSSIAAPPGAALAPGCRAPSRASAAMAAEVATTERPVGPNPTASAAGASQTATAASGTGSAAYVTDSRGVVVRGSSGECWRTGTWTPAQATVVGCDGVLARALPVPAPAEPGKSEAAPPLSAHTPPGGEQSVPAPSTRPTAKAPVAPVAPVPPGPATAAPAARRRNRQLPNPSLVPKKSPTIPTLSSTSTSPCSSRPARPGLIPWPRGSQAQRWKSSWRSVTQMPRARPPTTRGSPSDAQAPWSRI